VAYRLNKRESSMKYQDIKGSGSTTTDVSGLEKYTEYIIQVLAYTDKDSPWSKERKTRTLEDGKYIL